MNEKNAVSPWYLYLIKTKSSSLYCGITTDVELRFDEHAQQGAKCAKYLRGKAPLTLVYQHPFEDKSTALKYEYAMKRLSKKQKLSIVRGKLDLLEVVQLK